MDLGLNGIIFELLKQHWLLLTALCIGLLFLKILFEIILPSLIKDHRNNLSFKKGALWRSDQDLLHWLRSLSPIDFEEYVATLFRKLGYRAEAIGQNGDHGVDVEIEKDGVVSYIQCKKYSQKHKVGEPEVRNFLGSLAHKHSQAKGYFITTGIFTLQAERFVEDKPIELVDGLTLVKYIRLTEKNIEQSIDTNVCPRCGGVLVERDGKFGTFIGCSNFPKCRFTEKI